MPSINSFADVLRDWEALLAALQDHPGVLVTLEAERLDLEADLAAARVLKARQETQTASRQEVTQQIKAVVSHGKGVAIGIRAVVKGKIGYRNERLVQFKVAPSRKRPRKPPEVEPTEEAAGPDES